MIKPNNRRGIYMKKLSREKITLLILVIMLFVIGIGLLIWQGFDNNRVISSVAIGQYLDKQIKNNNNSGKGDKDHSLDTTESIYSQGSNGDKNNLKAANTEDEPSSIMIHVAGEVVNPGVYQIPIDSRVVHAIEFAGGATSLANLDIINLALPISDGQKIYIPSVVEKLNQVSGVSAVITDDSSSGNSSSKININTASASKLEELSGIGPSKAGSIIDYRNDNGRFESVDDLLQVSGIGEKTLQRIKDDIVVR